MEFYNTNISHHQASKKKNDQEFLSLYEYLELSEILIRKFFPTYNYFLKDEDKISYVAEKIMMADWCYDESKNKARKSHRWERGYWAIKELIRINFVQRQQNQKELEELQKWYKDSHENEHKKIERQALIREIMDTQALSEREREAINLTILNKNSAESASSIMDMCASSVNNYKNRGLKKLRKIWAR